MWHDATIVPNSQEAKQEASAQSGQEAATRENKEAVPVSLKKSLATCPEEQARNNCAKGIVDSIFYYLVLFVSLSFSLEFVMLKTDLIQILQRFRDKLRIHHDISLHISSYLFTFLESQLRQECLYGSSMKCRSKASKASKA